MNRTALLMLLLSMTFAYSCSNVDDYDYMQEPKNYVTRDITFDTYTNITAKRLFYYYDGTNLIIPTNNHLYISTDEGVNWSDINLTTYSHYGINGMTGIAYGNSVWVACQRQYISTSPDLVNWTYRGMQDYASGFLIFWNNLFITTRWDGNSSPNHDQILTSLDGISWTKSWSNPGSSGEYVVCVSNYCIADDVLLLSGNYGKYLRTTNGLNYTYSTGDYRMFFYGNGIVVAVSGYNKGVIYTSEDKGQTWTTRSLGIDSYLDYGAYGDGKYIVVGRNGVVFLSTDAVNWTQVDIGTTKNLQKVAYYSNFNSKKIFVIMGDGSTFISSAGNEFIEIEHCTTADTTYYSEQPVITKKAIFSLYNEYDGSPANPDKHYRTTLE